MIETIENSLQLALLLACTGISAVYTLRSRDRAYLMLTLFFGSYALGDLHWLLFLLFYGHTPLFSYVSDLSWYGAFLYLFLLLQELSTPEEWKVRHPLIGLPIAFVIAMCAFYMQWGEAVSNVICALLMGLLATHATRGLLYLRTQPLQRRRRALYIVTLAFCAIEYATWTSSCFWSSDTWANPYFWFDCLMTACCALFLPATRKAVTA